MVVTERPKYIALGDSTGVGVGAHDGRGYVHRIARALGGDAGESGVALANLCVSGATSSDVLARQVPRMEGFRSATTDGALFTLLIGVNDLWRGATSSTFGQTYTVILERMRKVGGERARIFVASLPDMANAPAASFVESQFGVTRVAIGKRVADFNQEIRRAAHEAKVGFVDLSTESLAGQEDVFSADGFHPSSAGYERLARIFLNAIEATKT